MLLVVDNTGMINEMAAEQGGEGGFRQGRFISAKYIISPRKKVSSLKWPRKKKEGKTKYFFGLHTKSQSNVLTRFHYTPRTKKSFVASKN